MLSLLIAESVVGSGARAFNWFREYKLVGGGSVGSNRVMKGDEH
jgi:hypothetical protein